MFVWGRAGDWRVCASVRGGGPLLPSSLLPFLRSSFTTCLTSAAAAAAACRIGSAGPQRRRWRAHSSLPLLCSAFMIMPYCSPMERREGKGESDESTLVVWMVDSLSLYQVLHTSGLSRFPARFATNFAMSHSLTLKFEHSSPTLRTPRSSRKGNAHSLASVRPPWPWGREIWLGSGLPEVARGQRPDSRRSPCV